MERTDPLGVRVPPDLKAALIAAAIADDRSLASLVERALREWLTSRNLRELRGAGEADGTTE